MGNNRLKIQFQGLVLAAVLFLMPMSAAHAMVDINTCATNSTTGETYSPCLTSGFNGYNPTPPGVTYVSLYDNVQYYAARSNPGLASEPIDAWDYCRYVDNNNSAASDISYFVPFNTATEWYDFRTNAPKSNANIVLSTCARPTSASLGPNPSSSDPNTSPASVGVCTNATPSAQQVALDYARSGGAPIKKIVTFSCTVKGICDANGCGADQTGLTRTVTATYTPAVSTDGAPNDGDFKNSGWQWTSVAYSNLPTPNPAPAPVVVASNPTPASPTAPIVTASNPPTTEPTSPVVTPPPSEGNGNGNGGGEGGNGGDGDGEGN